MRKLAFVGVLAAALSGSAWADDTQEKAREAQTDLDKAKAEASKDTREAQAEASKEVGEARAEGKEKVQDAQKEANEEMRDAQSQGTASGSEARDRDPAAGVAHDKAQTDDRQGGMMGSKHPVFTKDNFDVEGRIQNVSKGSITLRREELPAAKLNLDRNTKIELDGEKVSAMQLKPGQEVKASFNLQNDKPMAVEIKAEKD